MTTKTAELADAIAARFTETVAGGANGLATKADLVKLAAQFAALEVAVHTLSAAIGGTATVAAVAPKVAARPAVGATAEKKQAINIWFSHQVVSGNLRQHLTPAIMEAAAVEIAGMKAKPAADSPEYWKKVAGVAWKLMDKALREGEIRAAYAAGGPPAPPAGDALEVDEA